MTSSFNDTWHAILTLIGSLVVVYRGVIGYGLHVFSIIIIIEVTESLDHEVEGDYYLGR